MSLKEAKGNMYPWVTHTHTHLGGECPHRCSYCYVDNPRWGRPARYQGSLRLIEKELSVDYGAGKTIFIENCHDLFAHDVPEAHIRRIMCHCHRHPQNTYVFQTKNPKRFDSLSSSFPKGSILGTTIETNRDTAEFSRAPRPLDRMLAMEKIKEKKFVTIEPVMDFDINILAEWMERINPEFLNLGADSKGHHLPEPPLEKILALIERLRGYGLELREKHNLNRLMRR